MTDRQMTDRQTDDRQIISFSSLQTSS